MPVSAFVGLPGSGKSTVGKSLARARSLRFFDTDTEIERRTGASIAELFESIGEGRFRDIEESVIAELSGVEACVLATGGGAVLRGANRRALRESSTVIYLRADPHELYRRLRHDRRRPLLQVDDPWRKLRDLYDQRDPLYRETAHLVIDSSDASIGKMVTAVLAGLDALRHGNPGRRELSEPPQDNPA